VLEEPSRLAKLSCAAEVTVVGPIGVGRTLPESCEGRGAGPRDNGSGNKGRVTGTAD